eukprot:Nk52_evm45s352 gene=Nk52_evmTU45s352
MRASAIALGASWGNLTKRKVTGVTYYSISPFEQRAFAKFISHAPANVVRRVAGSFFDVVPGFAFAYAVYAYGTAEHDRLMRKQPGDFDNEVIEN